MLDEQIKEQLSLVADRLGAGADRGDTRIRAGFRGRIMRFLASTRTAIYPKIFGGDCALSRTESLTAAAEELSLLLAETVEDTTRHGEILRAFLAALPDVVSLLESDVQAAYEGDPAARSAEEIMWAYPAFEAISIYRIAHVLFSLGVPLLPRMMTEYAHKNTGIDIHPGATIGRYFFIDHGTGVVIGETCRIGERVKLYQGVTLGAKSFDLDENGNPVKGIKRHPDIGNRVIVYANATILGGNTVVGDDCVIGGNVWLTHSVEPGRTIYYQGQ